ncbi:MAG: DUF4268 domain-containing protein [Bacteroidales bacterium]|nr:DUF4268 domain-containing protein [Bacteroidales bacterium]
MVSTGTLGTLERVELRTVWPHEEYDFSAWLAEEENLEKLSNSIGIDISLIEKESKVGGYSADIFAVEEETGKKIIIENQLEDTNHDHLGKIITYASGKDANYIIWIVKKARDEHRRAIEWLNEHTDSEIQFFLLEIELWKIGDSMPAPKFNIVEQPNNWAKDEKKSSVSVTETGRKCQDFWDAFNSYAENDKKFIKDFKTRKPQPQNWYDLGIGNRNMHISMNLQFKKGTLNTGIYIPDDVDLYNDFVSIKADVEKAIGTALIWHQANKASRFFVVKNIDINDSANWEQCFKWLIEMNFIFKDISKKSKK